MKLAKVFYPRKGFTDKTSSGEISKSQSAEKSSHRKDARLGDEAVAKVDRAGGEGDIALTSVGVALVPKRKCTKLS